MGLLDSDSEGSYSEDEVSFEGDSGAFGMPTLKRGVSGASTNSTISVTEGTLEERLSAVMNLKTDLGVDDDPDIRARQEHKDALLRAQEEERKKLAAMTTNERIAYQKDSVGSMMDKIRTTRARSKSPVRPSTGKRNGMNDSSHSSGGKMNDSSRVSAGNLSTSMHSLSDDEADEFLKLREKKNRRKKRAGKKPVNKKAGAPAAPVKA
ncbi:expressed unknown protein [Seminavis robusta]|uniref:Uncharacterized protein n=1 Tax=Seminavis robusta TaxID=568900 RepID=A0A9N8DVU1_9STRA|nr:expressed unknown protein [Seminavis robusta]|eukprot:Sro390_g132760.1 n/a (208) ;mRNA; r:10829-11452